MTKELIVETRCKQVINGRQCTHKPQVGAYCHQHHDQGFHARVARKCGISKGVVEAVAAALVDEMGWPEIDAYNAEWKNGQSVYEDAGGYVMRCLGRLFGVKPRDEVVTYQSAMKAMLKEAK